MTDSAPGSWCRVSRISSDLLWSTRQWALGILGPTQRVARYTLTFQIGINFWGYGSYG